MALLHPTKSLEEFFIGCQASALFAVAHLALGAAACGSAVEPPDEASAPTDPDPPVAPGNPGAVSGAVTDEEPRAQVDPNPVVAPSDSGAISGVVTDAGSEAPIGGVYVCADVDYVTRCGNTDDDGAYSLQPIIGFESVDITFVADGYPTARMTQKLVDGSAWTYARLPSNDDLARFNQRLDLDAVIGLGDVIVHIERASTSTETVSLDAARITFGSGSPEPEELTVFYADDDGMADATLGGTLASLASVSVHAPALVQLTVGPNLPCRFRGGLTTTTSVVAHPGVVSLVDLACAEGLSEL